MKAILTFCVIFSIFSLILSGSATVSLRATYYNSNMAFGEDITLENANYNGYTKLDPEKITFMGLGGSVGSAGSKFSYEMTCNDNNGNNEQIGASIETSSGSYICASQLGKDKNIKMNSKMGISEDGEIETTFYNNNGQISEELNTVGGAYSKFVSIDPVSIESKGFGMSKKNSDNYLLRQLIFINTNDKWALIDTRQDGNVIDYYWTDLSKINSGGAFMGAALATSSTDGDANIGMTGTASNFPSQHLPPGELVIHSEFGTTDEIKQKRYEAMYDAMYDEGDPTSDMSEECLSALKVPQRGRLSEYISEDPKIIDADGSFEFALRMRFKLNDRMY